MKPKFYNMIFKNENNEQLADPIVYLAPYHKYWSVFREVKNPNFDTHSENILELKKGNQNAINHFFRIIDPLIVDGIALCYVPSHDPEKTSSGIRNLAMALSRVNNRIDATSCLIRHTFVEKLAHGNNRNINVHLNSISATNLHLINGKEVLILDDVTTTNNSLKACLQLLRNAGAKNVRALALGQTIQEG